MNEPQALEIILNLEDEHTERKAALNGYNLKDVYKYVVALSNEGGGRLLLGVRDDGSIGGTQAFQDIQKLKIDILHQPKISRRIRIEVDVFTLESKRVLIITVPSRHRGEPDSYDGAFLMRSGVILKCTMKTVTSSTNGSVADKI
jgi:ATP-dependent DNA helicase RecG